jgi:hypothetical protein
MITMELTNNPGYPTRNPNYLGTIHHQHCSVAASVNSDYYSTLEVRRYLCGLEPANYPAPALRCIVDIYPNQVWITGDEVFECIAALPGINDPE